TAVPRLVLDGRVADLPHFVQALRAACHFARALHGIGQQRGQQGDDEDYHHHLDESETAPGRAKCDYEARTSEVRPSNREPTHADVPHLRHRAPASLFSTLFWAFANKK